MVNKLIQKFYGRNASSKKSKRSYSRRKPWVKVKRGGKNKELNIAVQKLEFSPHRTKMKHRRKTHRNKSLRDIFKNNKTCKKRKALHFRKSAQKHYKSKHFWQGRKTEKSRFGPQAKIPFKTQSDQQIRRGQKPGKR